MKVIIKLTSTILFFFLLFSCGSHPSKKMSQIIKSCPIGTSEKVFNTNFHGQELVFSNQTTKIYKVTITTFNYIHHSRSDYRYFYFENGYLSRIDKGERKVDYRIKIDN